MLLGWNASAWKGWEIALPTTNNFVVDVHVRTHKRETNPQHGKENWEYIECKNSNTNMDANLKSANNKYKANKVRWRCKAMRTTSFKNKTVNEKKNCQRCCYYIVCGVKSGYLKIPLAFIAFCVCFIQWLFV